VSDHVAERKHRLAETSYIRATSATVVTPPAAASPEMAIKSSVSGAPGWEKHVRANS
jgi:hypothetical protein